MTNIELLNLVKSKLENVRLEINDLLLEIEPDNNYDLIFDTLSTELESDMCSCLDIVDNLIDDIE